MNANNKKRGAAEQAPGKGKFEPMFYRGRITLAVLLAGLFISCLSQAAPPGSQVSGKPKTDFRFTDVTHSVGLLPAVAGIRGHAAGWGDADGNGWPDLYVGTFHTGGSKPNLFFRNSGGQFTLDPQKDLRISTRPTGVLFADLDNDGDLDLYVSSMPKDKDSRLAQRIGHPLSGCTLFRNDGNGRFTNISEENGACPKAFGGRGATVLDFDGDGLLDLLVAEDPIPGYNGSPTSSTRLFRNQGKLQFKDVSQERGLPERIPGLGVASADVNQDGWPDLFIACHKNGNRLFLNDGSGHFHEAPGTRELFHWPSAGGDNMVCGVAFGDVNGDGLLDLVLGQHFEKPWIKPVPNRLYLNRGIEDGVPLFEEVTQQAGLVPLPMKAPHVEIQDFNNDGRPDIYTSIVKFAQGKPHPVIFKNQGTKNGIPRFQAAGLDANNFPTAKDRSMDRTVEFFDRMIAEKKIIYTAAGPSADYNRDGRLDLFLANWWIESPSMLLRNQTRGGHWLQVTLQCGGKVNRMGIGAQVKVYPASSDLQNADLLGIREISTGDGYASGQTATAHFGLGRVNRVTLEIVLPHNRGTIIRKNVNADQLLVIQPE